MARDCPVNAAVNKNFFYLADAVFMGPNPGGADWLMVEKVLCNGI